MTTESMSIPTFPQARSRDCPFDPPRSYMTWDAPERVRLWDGTFAWVVTGYEDIRAVLADPRISAYQLNPGMPRLQPVVSDNSTQAEETVSFVRMDDPEHARHRLMLTGEFTVRRAESLRPWIQELVDELIDAMLEKGPPAELVSDFALPIPTQVIAHMLGVPYSEHKFFEERTTKMLGLTTPPDVARAARDELTEFLAQLISAKESDPGDDIISRVRSTRVAAGELTHPQLVHMIRTLLVAGHETTANMIALGTLTLLQHADQLARVRDTDDPALIANAVEELLRYLTIVENVVTRVAIEDITVGGRLIQAGDGIIISLPPANREAHIPGDPSAFDISRNARGHIAFGYGIHQCLGQNLARVELQIALPTLLRRLPELKLAVPFDEVPFKEMMGIYGLEAMPVSW